MSEEKKKYNFKCYEQTCADRVCCTRSPVLVTFGDISRWITQNFVQEIFPGLTLNIPKDEGEIFSIETLRNPLEEGSDKTACIFFVKESNACAIRYSRPISCQTFPLAYDGEKFYVTDNSCSGIGQGEVTKEALKDARDLADKEYRERSATLGALPGVYSIIITDMMRKSAEMMKDMKPEDREKLEELMSKEQDEKEEPETE